MKEAKLEQESKPRKYERIFIISFLTTIVLIIGVPSGKCGFTTLRKFNVKKPNSNSYGIRLS